MSRGAAALTCTLVALLVLAACGGGGGDDASTPGPSATSAPTSPPTAPPTATPTSTLTPPVDCAALVDAVNADVAPLLAGGDFAATDDLPQACSASDDRGDRLSVLALDLPDEGCLGEVQRLPALGAGSSACVGEQQGAQVLQATVIAEGATESLNALVELAPSPEQAFTTDDLAPVAATLARAVAGLTP